MMLRSFRARSLHSRLLLLLFLPVTVVLAISVVADYRTAVHLSNDSYDQVLLGMATALASRLERDADDAPLELDLPAAAEAVLRADRVDAVRYQVVMQDGRMIAGDKALSVISLRPAPDEHRFGDVQIGGTPMRFVALGHAGPGGRATVVVAQTLRRRQQVTGDILGAVIWPNVVLLTITVAVIYFGVRVGLRPLARLGGRIDARAQDDFGPLDEGMVPYETRPLVAAINRLMARVEAAGRAQQVFLSNAAHQLGTPLAGMQTQLELAEQDFPAAARDRLLRLRNAVAHLVHLTRQMLALARSAPEAHPAMPQATVDLAELVEGCASDALDAALRRDVELSFEPAEARIFGVAWLLHELLMNLIDNAIAYAPSGGHVVVRCGRQGEVAWLEVEDDGPGIAPDERERIFARFYRGRAAAPGGSGLGLAIAREVADRHRATIAVGEGAGGHGTRIRVSFPGVRDTS
ncbi:sensor histidine kinase [Nitrogeniibacter mangrovi]|uniref:histidine kinase n=1 Tax=Nitrogeniibacter mangrovi TaxID=2016596 RepID=A0A6C1B4C0_9RHOO|nr:sensor histidine kinase [Nitrogeniibacter mangrovi]QID18337.1 sensor histidine kinase [Nitrogeniibacter mangrovi]